MRKIAVLVGTILLVALVAAFSHPPTQATASVSLPCPDLLPPLHEWGPLCIADGVKAVQHGDIVSLTWWDMPLVEGPAPDTWFAHVFIREGEWKMLELGAMNHGGPPPWGIGHSQEITVMYHDGLEWHALGNKVFPARYEWVFLEYPGFPVWAGTEIGAVFRGVSKDDDLRLNLTLQHVATDEGGS